MTTERDKANRILKEIVSYFMISHIYDFDIHFHIDQEMFSLEIVAKVEEKPPTFERLLSDLSTPRQFELDEYCNSLLGAHGHCHDYTFLGKAIDEVEGECKDGKLRLFLKRFNVA